jgi:hypothetical protein
MTNYKKKLKMNKRYFLIVLTFLLAEIYSFAQHNVNSPYSMFGIGYIEPGGVGRNKAMGGAGIALPSEYTLNNLNPASYRSIDSMNFIFEAGVNGIYSKFKSNTQSQENTNGNFAYLAAGFRINRWWANSIGIGPYSNVGYKINGKKQIEGSLDYADIKIEGSGGLNKFYWGHSIKFNKNFSIGVNASYLFGVIYQTQTTTTSTKYMSGAITIEDESRLKNFHFDYGAQYSFKINSGLQGMIGAVYGSKTKLKRNQDFNITSSRDTLFSEPVRSGDFYIPEYYGFGAALKIKDKFIVTGDYTQSNWEATDNTASSLKYVNSNNFAFGMEFIPSTKPSARYMQIVRYRLGGYYENSYMQINGKQLKDYGVTAGIGFPLMRGKTFVNLALSAGFKGDPNSGTVINEIYYKVHLNFTLFDFWFNRSKFD